MEILRTHRLKLTTVAPEDEATLRLLYRDPDVMRFYPAERALDLAPIFVARMLSLYTLRGFGLWNVFLRANDEFVGQCGLVPAHVEGGEEYEVMIFLHRRFWRDGYAEEVLRATTAFCLRELGLNYVIGLIFKANRPSSLLARRSGYSFERRVSMLEGAMDLYKCAEQPNDLYETSFELHLPKPSITSSPVASLGVPHDS